MPFIWPLLTPLIPSSMIIGLELLERDIPATCVTSMSLSFCFCDDGDDDNDADNDDDFSDLASVVVVIRGASTVVGVVVTKGS